MSFFRSDLRDMMVDAAGESTLVRADGSLWQAPKLAGLSAARDEKWVTHQVQDLDLYRYIDLHL